MTKNFKEILEDGKILKKSQENFEKFFKKLKETERNCSRNFEKLLENQEKITEKCDKNLEEIMKKIFW